MAQMFNALFLLSFCWIISSHKIQRFQNFRLWENMRRTIRMKNFKSFRNNGFGIKNKLMKRWKDFIIGIKIRNMKNISVMHGLKSSFIMQYFSIEHSLRRMISSYIPMKNKKLLKFIGGW